MVSAKYLALTTLAASAAAAPAPEIVARQLSLSGPIADVSAVVNTVLGLVAGTLNAVLQPTGTTPSEQEVLATSFTALNGELVTLIKDLQSIPIVGGVATILYGVVVSPLVTSLLTLLEHVLTLVVGLLVDGLVHPLVSALTLLLGTISTLTSVLAPQLPNLAGELTSLLGVVTAILGNL
ncbi:hypothetical protein CJU90_5267 [Yarrowia sp. C11]|nr:hypothetical protein CJU90_5267 [Yarrowia sp. C11]KAG5365064.1 hypothetical protein CKK34_3895 [Yarrowia sp. E02]